MFSPGPMEIVIIGFFSPGPMEIIIIGAIAVLLFGKRLPDVARSVGKSFVEFKKGMRGIEDEMHTATYSSPSSSSYESDHEADDHEEATAPKFDPPAAEPQAETQDSEKQAEV